MSPNTPRDIWSNIHLQDSTEASDIDWSKGVADIDAQIYAKYGLTDDETTFIESMIRPM